jgi:hypothetical protein
LAFGKVLVASQVRIKNASKRFNPYVLPLNLISQAI